ncbi:hypothetical protein [uncultured Akkermansia sp.]|uniref:hypothetical protein n=1 Tax=uncultured Akkermansia sp. TaxID=512294 RepID=UPI00261D808D|nr:hypothetical protein [uncultured Akkermansia sp.]
MQSFFAETGQVNLKIFLPGRRRRGNILRSKKWTLNKRQSTQSDKKPPFAMFLHTGTSHSLMASVSAGKTAGRPASKARFTKTAFTALKTSFAAVSTKTAFTALESSFSTVFPETALSTLETSFAAVSTIPSIMTFD